MAWRPKCFLYGASKHASASYFSSLLQCPGLVGSVIGSTGIGSGSGATSTDLISSASKMFDSNHVVSLYVQIVIRNNNCCLDLLSGVGIGVVAVVVVAEVDGFGVDGADGVDVPDVDAVAELHEVWIPSLPHLPPLRP